MPLNNSLYNLQLIKNHYRGRFKFVVDSKPCLFSEIEKLQVNRHINAQNVYMDFICFHAFYWLNWTPNYNDSDIIASPWLTSLLVDQMLMTIGHKEFLLGDYGSIKRQIYYTLYILLYFIIFHVSNYDNFILPVVKTRVL